MGRSRRLIERGEELSSRFECEDVKSLAQRLFEWS
jgi:hypothetical protein